MLGLGGVASRWSRVSPVIRALPYLFRLWGGSEEEEEGVSARDDEDSDGLGSGDGSGSGSGSEEYSDAAAGLDSSETSWLACSSIDWGVG